MTTKELSLASLWERAADLEEQLYFKKAEIRDLQAEVEASNAKVARLEALSIDMSHQAKQLAQYAKALREDNKGGGTI